jgi:glycosyltransferase involved in cell wall biosynthesis
MRVTLLYETINEPWGGVNSFFRNFASHAESSNEVELKANCSDAELILSSGHYYAPGRMLKRFQLLNLSHGRGMRNPRGLISRKGSKKIVFRVDGLRRIYAQYPTKADDILIGNLSLADSVIFQSRFCKDSFDHLRIKYPTCDDIILNGTNTNIFYPASKIPDFSQGLMLISNSWSANLNKGFQVIASFSELENVTVLHIGRWPEGIPPNKVKLLGIMGENQVAEILRNGHFFLFPSEHDACSNTVVEALASGLPVLYHDSGGTPELCRQGLFGKPISTSHIETRVLQSLIQEALEKHSDMRNSILEHLEEFSFKYCLKQYIEHFKQLLS